MLLFDFSQINTGTEENTFIGFSECVWKRIVYFNSANRIFTDDKLKIIVSDPQPSLMMQGLFTMMLQKNITEKVYILIDEYDHFADEILAFNFIHFAEIISRPKISFRFCFITDF